MSDDSSFMSPKHAMQERLDELLDLWDEASTPDAKRNVRKMCADDPDLAEEFERSVDRLKRFQVFSAPVPEVEDVVPTHIGEYRVLKVLARGGTSTVFLCQQELPQRLIAVKLLHRETMAARRLRRFHLEVQLLATLAHPGIAQIYDAGMHDENIPYIAMEYIQGQRLDDFLTSGAWSQTDKIRLFLKISEALDTAHQQGITHRDLKPANILITPEGQPKLIDFGIAHLRNPDCADPADDSRTVLLAGTAPYMSPEQFKVDQTRVDSRSDIYSLTVVFFECLTRSRPYNFPDESIVACAQTIQNRPPKSLPQLKTQSDRHLNAILQKGLSKDPRDRYQTIREFQDDLNRLLHGRPVLAKPLGLWGQLVMLAKRHPRTAILSLGVTLVLFASSVLSTKLALFNARQAEELQTTVAQLEREQQRATNLALSVQQKNQTLNSVNRALVKSNDEFRRTVMNANLMRAALHLKTDPVLAESLLYDETYCPRQRRGLTWTLLDNQIRKSAIDIQVTDAPESRVFATALSSDGRVLVSVTIQHVRWWDTHDGLLLHSITDHIGKKSKVAVDSTANRSLILRDDGLVFLIDREKKEKFWLYPAKPSPASALAISSEDRRLAIGNTSGEIHLWQESTASQKADKILNEHKTAIVALRFGDQGRRLASMDTQGIVVCWDLENGRVLSQQKLPAERLTRGEFSADLRHVCAGTADRVLVWDREQKTVVQSESAALMTRLLHDPSEGLIVANPPLVAKRTADGQESVLHVRKSLVQSISISSDQSRLAVGSRDGLVSIYDRISWSGFRTIPSFSNNAVRVRFSPDGSLIGIFGMNTGKERGIHVHRTSDGELVFALHDSRIQGREFAFSQDGRRLITLAASGALQIWDIPSQTLHSEVQFGTGTARSLELLNNGTYLVSADLRTGSIRVGSIPQGKIVKQWKLPVSNCRSILINPNDESLLAVQRDGIVIYWDMASEKMRYQTDSQQREIREARLSPDGTLLITSAQRGNPTVWRVAANRLLPITTLQSQSSRRMSVDFSPDGTVLATGDATGHLVLWDTVTWQPQARLNHSQEAIRSVRFSPDGRFLAVTGSHGSINLWHIAPRS